MVTIRALRSDDKNRWNELWQGYLTFYGVTVADHITEHTWNTLLKDGAGHSCLVAENDAGEIIGITHYLMHPSTWCTTCYCYLEDVFVDPAARGQGAGQALVEAVYEVADEADATRVYWNTQTHNETARRLYDKLATLSDFVQYRRQGTPR